ncbi:hypothetical protein BDU57DRAFT_18010 [Ampelomyces quisqualis]|uniref:Zn(2)-C6 fungal-type domain-containing protein n=1 Tax=Ampelomyces quisqualis TaxID=50730 RepID=A0A6A5QYL7_AMPQU|nr:hypothetical protein BDU57DRAFT_18010 [Ampelomyces quisqualis]
MPPSSEKPSKTQNAPSRVRRRNRQINSCLECRRRKLKCDKGSPCANCTKLARPCIFIASGLDAGAQKRLTEVKEKMGVLERSLEEDVARHGHTKSRDLSDAKVPIRLPGQEENHSDQEDDEDTKHLNISSFVTEDAAYYDDDANLDDEILDLGISIGRMRVTERIGGVVRPRFAEEFAQTLRALPPTKHARLESALEPDPQTWLAPSRDYLAPSSSFFFAPGIEETSLMTYLPAKFMVDKLIAHYWEAVHVIARILHRPSFERSLDKFWADVDAGREPRRPFQAVFFAALLSSIVSKHEEDVVAEFGVDKHSLVDDLKRGTEAALARASFLRTTKLETLQAFVMYIIPLCRGEISRSHSALTGTVIRLAQCMGLHRDPTNYTSSPVQIHVRRLVWYQICFLDFRTYESTGPRPQIRLGDYDTQFPLNIDDDDLDRAEHGDSEVDVKRDRSHCTDMTITRMRFECYEMHRFLWSERPKLEQRRADGERKVTLVTLLRRVQSFKAAMEKTYLPILSRTDPLHVLASEIYGILSDRLYVVLLQKYITSDRTKMPLRLRQLVMGAALRMLEHSMVIEQEPALSKWSWYMGAIQQYHPAILLLNEVYVAQNEPEIETRIWRAMDFSFGLEPGRSNEEKFRFILEELAKKSRIYTTIKGIRAPTNMPHAGPRTLTKSRAKQQEENRRTEIRESNLKNPSMPSSAYRPRAPAQQQPSPPQVLPYQSPTTISTAAPSSLSFPGAVPVVDWGTISLSEPISTTLHPVLETDFDFNEFSPSMPMETLILPNTLARADQRLGSDSSSPGAAIHGEFNQGSTGGGPMDVMEDIDWNEIDKMFGHAESGSVMMMPPYTFPQFQPGDLNM